MSFNHPKAGPNFVPAYQVSGIPYVTSSLVGEVPGPDSDTVSKPVSITFPFVTKFITVRNTGINELRVGFSADGVIDAGEQRATSNVTKVVTSNASGNYAGKNYFLIPSASYAGNTIPFQTNSAETVQTFNVRCKQIFFLSDVTKASNPTTAENSTSFSLIAGLTSIMADQFPVLTGSNGFEGVG